MVMGNVGSGKSSFINTLFTVFRNNGQISTIASPHGINKSSTTKRVCETDKKNYYCAMCNCASDKTSIKLQLSQPLFILLNIVKNWGEKRHYKNEVTEYMKLI